MDILYLSKEDAKSFLVNYHMINVEDSLFDYDSIEKVFDKLMSIQYDPLNVVGNNSELVLQSRIANYRLGWIQKALYEDRFIVDGWDKQMSIYKTIDFPYFKRIRTDRAKGEIGTMKYRLQIDALNYIDDILHIISADGPKYSKDIKLGENVQHVWGSSKPSNLALSYLFHRGDIGIKERNNTQKKYDLMERLIGEKAKEAVSLTDREFMKWYTLRRVQSLGLVWNKTGVHWSGHMIQSKSERTKVIQELVQEGILQKIMIEGINEPFYATYESLLEPIKVEKKVSFIAPLDNLIWDRTLIEEVFGFEYRWEVYTPIIKRKYGYYVLPILYGNTFVGRIEFEQQRNNDPLIINKVWIEDDMIISDEFALAFEEALIRFKEYLGASEIIKYED